KVRGVDEAQRLRARGDIRVCDLCGNPNWFRRAFGTDRKSQMRIACHLDDGSIVTGPAAPNYDAICVQPQSRTAVEGALSSDERTSYTFDRGEFRDPAKSRLNRSTVILPRRCDRSLHRNCRKRGSTTSVSCV